MKLSHIYSAAIIISSHCLLSSCEADLELNVQDADKTYLVVDGMITNEAKAHCIRLSTTYPYFGKPGSHPVKGAEVVISDGTESIELTEKQDGEYYTPENWSALYGKTYTLTVSTDQEGVAGVYQAESTMPEPGGRYEKLDYYYEKDSETWVFKGWFQDYPEIISYYVISTELNGQRLNSVFGVQNGNSYFNGVYLNGVKLVSLKATKDGGLDKPLETGDFFTLYQYCAPKAYYDFVSAVGDNTQISLPVLMPQPANCPTNISGGALGFFSVCYVEPLSVTITDPYKPESGQ